MQMVTEKNRLRLVTEEDLTQTHAVVLRELMLASLSQPGLQLVTLNLGGTQHIDHQGLKLLLGLCKTCQSKGLPLEVETQNIDLLGLFEALRLTALMNIKQVE